MIDHNISNNNNSDDDDGDVTIEEFNDQPKSLCSTQTLSVDQSKKQEISQDKETEDYHNPINGDAEMILQFLKDLRRQKQNSLCKIKKQLSVLSDDISTLQSKLSQKKSPISNPSNHQTISNLNQSLNINNKNINNDHNNFIFMNNKSNNHNSLPKSSSSSTLQKRNKNGKRRREESPQHMDDSLKETREKINHYFEQLSSFYFENSDRPNQAISALTDSINTVCTCYNFYYFF
jgi:hypothetical protein